MSLSIADRELRPIGAVSSLRDAASHDAYEMHSREQISILR